MTSGPAPDPTAAVAEALAVLDIPSSTSHSWMGEVVRLPEVVGRVCDRNGLRKALVGSICSTLYDCFYTQCWPRPARRAFEAAGTERIMSHELSAANAGAGCLEPGWRVVGKDEGRHIVQRGGLRLWVAAEEMVGGTATGDDVALRLPAELPLYSPGFYIARGDRGFSAELPRVLDRFYLDVRPEGAVPFVREATRRLNQAGLAFSAKVVDDPVGLRSARLGGARLRAPRPPAGARRGRGPPHGDRRLPGRPHPGDDAADGAGPRVRGGPGRRPGLRLASLRSCRRCRRAGGRATPRDA